MDTICFHCLLYNCLCVDKLFQTLTELQKNGIIIQKVHESRNWVHNLEIVRKKNGTLRLCLDPQDLNKCIKRKRYLIPTLEEISDS